MDSKKQIEKLENEWNTKMNKNRDNNNEVVDMRNTISRLIMEKQSLNNEVIELKNKLMKFGSTTDSLGRNQEIDCKDSIEHKLHDSKKSQKIYHNLCHEDTLQPKPRSHSKSGKTKTLEKNYSIKNIENSSQIINEVT